MKKVLSFLAIAFGCTAHAQIITTIAGNGSNLYNGDGIAATTAGLVPQSVAIDSIGNVYIADANFRVRKVDTSGIISTVAGTGGSAKYAGDGVPATTRTLSPGGINLDGSGNLYIADWKSSAVRKIDISGIITTLAGNDTAGYSGDGGPATNAELVSPITAAMDGAGNLYIADYSADDDRIRMVNLSGIISTFAGNGIEGSGGDGGPATAAELFISADIAVDRVGNLYIADQVGHRIRRVNPSGIITTIAGNGIGAGGPGTFSGDGGPATAAGLYVPWGVAVDAIGNVYIGDYGNNRIRKVNIAGIITTIAGAGATGIKKGGFSGDGGPATAAELSEPMQIRLDCGGNLYIPDQYNNRVRKITYNHAPYFGGGHTQSLAVCQDTAATAINDLMAVFDIDTLQGATWRMLQPPVHGTAAVMYAATTTGGTLTPSGLSYMPISGYLGTDTFRVVVTDCGHLSDTTVVYVTVSTGCPAAVAAPPGLPNGEEIAVYPNPNSGTFMINFSSPVSEQVSVSVTNMMGVKVKTFTIASNKEQETELNVPAGVYFLSVSSAGGRYVQKVVVE